MRNICCVYPDWCTLWTTLLYHCSVSRIHYLKLVKRHLLDPTRLLISRSPYAGTCIFLRAGKLQRMFETFGILENFAKRKCRKNKYPYGTLLQNCRLGNPRIHARHSAVIREPSVDTS